MSQRLSLDNLHMGRRCGILTTENYKIFHPHTMVLSFNYFKKLHQMLANRIGAIFPSRSPQNSPDQDGGRCSQLSITVASTWGTPSPSPSAVPQPQPFLQGGTVRPSCSLGGLSKSSAQTAVTVLSSFDNYLQCACLMNLTRWRKPFFSVFNLWSFVECWACSQHPIKTKHLKRAEICSCFPKPLAKANREKRKQARE